MSEVEVHYISTCMVRPSSIQTPSESYYRCELTPWDLALLSVQYIQKGLLFIKPPPSKQPIISLLKSSLSRVLNHFIPLAGRLSFTIHDNDDPPTTSFFINCNNEGAQFIHAAANITVSNILDPLYVPPIVQSFFPLNGAINHDGLSQPLLAIQITELIDGIFIGCSWNHIAADGTSFWNFMNSWSEISRGIEPISRPPILKRWFLENGEGSSSPPPIRFSLEGIEFINRSTSSPALFLERVFHFSAVNIANLKAKANAELGSTNKISSLQALLAHMWRSVIRARSLPPDQETNYRILVGYRPRMNPPLPQEYFGNVVQIKTVRATVRKLLEGGLGWVAELLNQEIVSQTDSEARGFLENWMKKPVFFGVNGDQGEGCNLLTGSSPRFNVYGNDFGWGVPEAVRSGAGNKSDGKLTVFPGAIKGSIDVEVCLKPETLRSLGDDPEFMEAVTIVPPRTFYLETCPSAKYDLACMQNILVGNISVS